MMANASIAIHEQEHPMSDQPEEVQAEAVSEPEAKSHPESQPEENGNGEGEPEKEPEPESEPVKEPQYPHTHQSEAADISEAVA